MQADRFTIKSQEALAAAQRLAETRRNPQVTAEHLLAVLLEQDGGVVVPVLRKLGVDPAVVRREVDAALEQAPTLGEGGEGSQAGSELVSVLRAAEHEARELKDEYVSTEHLLLALAASGTPAGDALTGAGADRDGILAALAEVRGPHRVTGQNPEDQYQAREKYGRDLTAAAAEGIDPGRIVLATYAPSRAAHLARLALADLGLDTHLYNGHTTTADLLYAGVPVVTAPSETLCGRLGGSIVAAAGLPELVAENLAEYERMADRAISDAGWRQSLRRRLATPSGEATLFDARLAVRRLEGVLISLAEESLR